MRWLTSDVRGDFAFSILVLTGTTCQARASNAEHKNLLQRNNGANWALARSTSRILANSQHHRKPNCPMDEKTRCLTTGPTQRRSACHSFGATRKGYIDWSRLKGRDQA